MPYQLLNWGLQIVIFYFHNSFYTSLALFFKEELYFLPSHPCLWLMDFLFFFFQFITTHTNTIYALWYLECPTFSLYYWISKMLVVKPRKKTKCNGQNMGFQVKQLSRKLPLTNKQCGNKQVNPFPGCPENTHWQRLQL